jgi:hypothetical protein
MLGGMEESSDGMPVTPGRPATRALEAAGFRTLADLRGVSERELLGLHGVGPRAIRVLREHGVELVP